MPGKESHNAFNIVIDSFDGPYKIHVEGENGYLYESEIYTESECLEFLDIGVGRYDITIYNLGTGSLQGQLKVSGYYHK